MIKHILQKFKFIRFYLIKYLFKDFATDYISLNIKYLYAYIAESKKLNVLDKGVVPSPEKINLLSKPCTQSDLESSWSRYWINELGLEFTYHRKHWEYSYVLQTLHNYNMLCNSRVGLGLGCGQEPLPSYLISKGCLVTAGDKPSNSRDKEQRGWSDTNQYTKSVDSLYFSQFVSRQVFDNNFSLDYIDMNNLPVTRHGFFDFCWSICAVEHLGSINNGLLFLENTLNLLKKGGVSVHTLEFNILSDTFTIDHWSDVLFRKQDLNRLSRRIKDIGGRVVDFDFNFGSDILDNYIDVPPYPHQNISFSHIRFKNISNPHLKLLINNFPSTCFGVIIEKL